MSAARHRDVVVVGGGIIGSAVAWRLAATGRDVELFDPDPSRAASRVAAGMLAPVTEATPEESPLAALGIASVELWADFAATLSATAGVSVNHRTTGTLHVARDADALAELETLAQRLGSMGLPFELLGAAEVRGREPLLAPAIRGGLFAATDHVVEPRAVLRALGVALRESGVVVTPMAVTELLADGVVVDDGSTRTAGHVVLAAGAWSGELADLPVRPVRGETLHLATMDGHPGIAGNVRGTVEGRSVYLAARGDGRTVVGSTMEERGFDTRTRVGAVRDLLADARAIVPAVDEMELVEIAVGLRPGSPDNGPLIGELRAGLVAATGHFRNGILLAPITVAAVVDAVEGNEPDPVVAPFRPDRFRP